ncbi:MAG TPA: hypothetical protein VFQ53_19160 [Kofleriaceae bacterium]|nr:hypothetical protein [Kofleriaceae bacterium]
MLLRRHVRGRADEAVRAGQLRIVGRRPGRGIRRVDRHRVAGDREAEVGDPRAPAVVHDRVVRLEVAMDDPRGVRGREPRGALREHVDDRGGRGPGLGEPRAQRPPGDVLHRDEHAVVPAADVEHADDVRMIDPRERAALAEHPLLDERVLGDAGLRLHELDRQLAIELAIVRAVDDAHRAGTELAGDRVAIDELADRGQRVPRHDRLGAAARRLGQRDPARLAGIDVELERLARLRRQRAADERAEHGGIGAVTRHASPCYGT